MGINVENAGWVDQNTNQPSKAGVIVVFYDKEVQDMQRTAEEGRACFKLKPYIRKEVPGDNLVAIDRPARDQDKYEFAKEWERYESKQTTVTDGTPVEQWPVLNRAQVAEFKALHIYTVEQFVEMPMGHGSKIMGFNNLREQAQKFLGWQKESAQVAEIKAKDAEKDAKLAEQAEMLEQLQARLSALESAPKRGKPRKSKESVIGKDSPIAIRVLENVANAA